jgi:hypothetical protein
MAGLVIGYVYLPNADKAYGSKSIEELEISLPFHSRDLRELYVGVKPFCNDSFSFELRPDAEILIATDGTVTKISNDSITLEPRNGVEIEYSPVENISVNIGDYVLSGNSIGTLKEGVVFLDFAVLNVNDNLYECPFLYFNDTDKQILENKFDLDFCSCNI